MKKKSLLARLLYKLGYSLHKLRRRVLRERGRMQHYQRNVKAIMMYCPTCGKMTMHRVDDRRVGSCINPHVFGMSKKQEKREKDKQKAAENQSLELFEG